MPTRWEKIKEITGDALVSLYVFLAHFIVGGAAIGLIFATQRLFEWYRGDGQQPIFLGVPLQTIMDTGEICLLVLWIGYSLYRATKHF